MNKSKPPGIDKIPVEIYKKSVELLFNKLHSLIKGIRKEERTWKDWTKNIILRDQVLPTLMKEAVLSYDTLEHSFNTWRRSPK